MVWQWDGLLITLCWFSNLHEKARTI